MFAVLVMLDGHFISRYVYYVQIEL